MSTYDKGDKPDLRAKFKLDDANIDPTDLAFKMKEPDGTVTTYVFGPDSELVKDGTGDYHVGWPIAQVGPHQYRWIATGNANGEEPGSFDVRPSNIA